MVRTNAIITICVAVLLSATLSPGLARLPDPTPEEKAKQEEAKAKAKQAEEKAKETLARAQDRVSQRYIEEQAKKGISVKPTPIAPPAPLAVQQTAPAASSAAPTAQAATPDKK